MEKYDVRMLYNKAAILLKGITNSYIVVGDLHIGMERQLEKTGIKLHAASENMAKSIAKIAKENDTSKIIILGDIKESILNPDSVERILIKDFFQQLSGFEITIALGNHDSRLQELINIDMRDEVLLDNVALIHGHAWPSSAAMQKDYLIAAHNHIAMSFREVGGIRSENHKAWLIADLNYKNAYERYQTVNKNIKLIVMPAFNDLITGMPVNEVRQKNISPLFRNHVFDYDNSAVYSMEGVLVGTPNSIRNYR